MTFEYDEFIVSNFDQALQSLANGATDAFFDYNLSEKDKATLSSIHISHSPFTPDHIAYLGLHDTLKLRLEALLQEVGNSKELSKNATIVISKIVDPIFKSYDIEGINLGCSAAKKVTSEITWHTDQSNKNYYYRVILAFKGSSTLFCRNYNNNTCEDKDIYSASPYQGAIFTHNKSIHSSPHLDEERLLLMFSVFKEPLNIIKNNDL